MSHFTRVRTVFKDAELLARVLRDSGFAEVEHHDEPRVLYGYQGDARPERAEVIVRRRYVGPVSNDIGFARQPDGSFQAIISEVDRHRYDDAWLRGLGQAYGHAAALQYAAAHGFDVVTDEVDRSGARRLTLRRPG